MAFRDIFAIDVRSLASVRIGFGLILLYDLGVRLPDLETHYSDLGMLTREARREMANIFGTVWQMSPYMLSGAAWFQGLLMAVSALAALAVTLGFYTRSALAVSWFLFIGLQARHPMVLQNCDVLLRCGLFWMMFLPISAIWSLDARNPPPKRVLSFASAAFLLQLMIMYYYTSVLKVDPQWTREGSAIYYALHLDHFTRPFGYWLAEQKPLIRVMTFMTWITEYVLPFLLLSPAWNGVFRILVISAMWGLHIGIMLCMDVGYFSLLCMVYWLAFLPSGVWGRVHRRPFVEDVRTLPQTWQKWVVVGLLFFIFATNQKRLWQPSYMQVFPDWLDAVGRVTGLDQHWNMFSPGVDPYGSWIIVEGTLADGSRVDLWHGGPADEAKPASVNDMYPSVPWRRIMVTLFEQREEQHRRGVLDYFTRKWSAEHEQQVIAARIRQIRTPTPPFDGSPAQALAEEKILVKWPE